MQNRKQYLAIYVKLQCSTQLAITWHIFIIEVDLSFFYRFYPQPVPRTVSKRLNMWLTLRLLLAIYLMHSSLCLDANYSLAMNYLQLHNYLQLQVWDFIMSAAMKGKSSLVAISLISLFLEKLAMSCCT